MPTYDLNRGDFSDQVARVLPNDETESKKPIVFVNSRFIQFVCQVDVAVDEWKERWFPIESALFLYQYL